MSELKFGAFVPQGWQMELADVRDPVEKYRTMSRCAGEAEQAGYDAIWLYDHFHPVPPAPTPRNLQFRGDPGVPQAVFECWSSMAALARDTTRVRLGQMITSVSYRPPALLAKMSSCIDVMSGGRLIVGLGAGWYRQEFEAYGYEFDDVPERLRRLREAVQVLKAMWTEERAQFEGRYYSLRGAINEPKPLQKPHPPLWIGGGGEKVTLRLVAQYGDACNLGDGIEPAIVRRKLDVLQRHCQEVGRDYSAIVKSANVQAILGSPTEVDRVVGDVARRTGTDEASVRGEYVVGTAEQLAEPLQAQVDAGIEYLSVFLPNMAEGGVIQRFAEEVVPLVRAAPAASA